MRITPLKIRNEAQAKSLLVDIGVSPEAVPILSPKTLSAIFKIEAITSWEANIIKQYLLSLGSDCAIERSALLKNKKTSIIVFGNSAQLKQLCAKLKNQPFTLKEIGQELSLCLENIWRESFIFKARTKTLKIHKPLICGIINVTPDSFSGDGLLNRPQTTDHRLQTLALKKVEEMVKAGAQMVDIGGESTRPFAKPLTEKEEISRVIPVLKAIRKEFKNILISVDTYKYKTAKAAVDAGADIINDITAFRNSPLIADLVAKYQLGYILMHMKGMPQTMQVNPHYKKGVVEEILDFFKERLAFAQEKGIAPEHILIDPGIGFGKTPEDNLRLLNELYKFKILGLPIFLGVSRKSFIGKILNADVDKRLIGTISSIIVSIVRGANIVRVHDVKEVSEALKVANRILNQ